MTPIERLKAAREQYLAEKHAEAAGTLFNIFVKEGDTGVTFFNPKFKREEYRNLIVLSLQILNNLRRREHYHKPSHDKLYLVLAKISLDLDISFKVKYYFDLVDLHKDENYFKENNGLVNFHKDLATQVKDYLKNIKPLIDREAEVALNTNIWFFFRRGDCFVPGPADEEIFAKPESAPKNFQP